MRPERLNPLFAETDSLEGVGPKLKKPLDKLGLTRVRDVIYHLPDRFVQRRSVADLDEASEGEQIVVALTPIEHRAPRSGRGPYRVLAQDAQIKVSSGYERLDRAALEAVRKWRYIPGKRGGVPEPMWFDAPINFSLEQP